MQQIPHYFKTLLIALFLSSFSLSAQEGSKEETEQMSTYEFKSLASSKKYKELLNQIPEARMRPYRLEGNIYEKLIEAIEDEVDLMGFSDVMLTKEVNSPLVESNFEGLFISGALQDKTFFRLDIVNESYKEKYPDFFEYGGLFLLNEEGDWISAEVSMYNRMLIATQAVDPKDKPAFSMIQLRLNDFAVFSIIDYSGDDRTDQLKDKIRAIRFNELMSIAEYLKGINSEKLNFVNYLLDEWDADELNGKWGTIAGMEFSYVAEDKDGNEMKFAYGCDTDPTPLEDRDYYPYEIKYKRSSGEVSEEEIEGVTYYYYPKTNGQSMLFAFDGKSFVNLAIENSGKPSALTQAKLNDLFSLAIDCDQYKDFKKEVNVLQKRLEQDEPMVRDLERSMSFNTKVNTLESSKAYETFAQLMGKMPKTDSIEPFTDSTKIEEDFKQLVEPIKAKLKTKIEAKKSLTTTDLVFGQINTLPAQVLNTELKLDGKNSNAHLSLTIVNESYQEFFDYPLESIVPLMLAQEGFLVDSFLKQNISMDAVGEFPSASTEVNLLGGSNALVVFIAEHASLTLLGLKEDYSIEELAAIVKELDQAKLLAIAEKYKTINESYWSVFQTFPKKVFEQEQTAVSVNQEAIKAELKQEQEGVYAFLVTYGHPFKFLEGGHYYFMVNCAEESSSSFKDQLSGNGYEELSEGKYTIFTYEQKYKGNAGTSMQAIVHKDYPNKQIVYTVKRSWEKSDLKDHFDKFFETEVDCEFLK